jgi:hypothetical protein
MFSNASCLHWITSFRECQQAQRLHAVYNDAGASAASRAEATSEASTTQDRDYDFCISILNQFSSSPSDELTPPLPYYVLYLALS